MMPSTALAALFNWHQETVGRVAVNEPHYNHRGLLEWEDLVVKANKTDGDAGYIEVKDHNLQQRQSVELHTMQKDKGKK